jgi:AbrB family looped-hinge helix DNA binding protein
MQAIFRGKTYGAATVGERGQFVIPAELRKALKIKSGDQLMIFAKLDKGIITLMHSRDFNKFVQRAAKIISKLERKMPKSRLL